MPPRRTMFFLLVCLLSLSVSAQERIMTYNLLNYPGSDTTRNAAFRTVIAAADPDILVAQEMTSQAGVNMIISSILNVVAPDQFAAGPFVEGYDTDNAIFVRSSLFTVLGNRPIRTALRDISEFTIRHIPSGDTLRIFSVHLKASSGSTNEAQRAAEVDSLRKVTDALPYGSAFLVVGDFNIYGASEAAYQKLLEVHAGRDGTFYDVFSMPGIWNNALYAPYHTQSPRVTQFGGGANGGMDDRFDLLLMSRSVKDSGRIRYLPGSMTAFGNDGNHYNLAVNQMPNDAVTQSVANALHDASDHLPVFASFLFSESPLPVQLTSFSATISSSSCAVLSWRTETEVSCYGFEVERRGVRRQNSESSVWNEVGFVAGNGSSSIPHEYSFSDAQLPSGRHAYRLKQIDIDGSFEYSSEIEVESDELPTRAVLEQNFPNPFNPETGIRYQVPGAKGQVSGASNQGSEVSVDLRVYDLLGREVAVLVDEVQSPGVRRVVWNAEGNPSGVYVCRLQIGGKGYVRRMVLMK